MGCKEIPGMRIFIKFDCIGKGTEEICTRITSKLRESLKKATEKMGISFKEINEVSYCYNPLNINKTIEELGIKNGAVISIKLKSTFNK